MPKTRDEIEELVGELSGYGWLCFDPDPNSTATYRVEGDERVLEIRFPVANAPWGFVDIVESWEPQGV